MEKPTVIYDGECRFCVARINGFRKRDAAGEFNYVARQDVSTEQRFPSIKGIQLDDGLLLIEPDQHIYVAADAVYHIARKLPTLKQFAWLYCVPVLKQIFQVLYWLVARYRKLLGQTCDKDSCHLP